MRSRRCSKPTQERDSPKMGSAADDLSPSPTPRPERAPWPPVRGADELEAAPRPGAVARQGACRSAWPAPVPSTERRYRQTINRVDLWSVLKVSVCFYICSMAVVMVALVALWVIGDAAGVITQRRAVPRRPAADEGLHVPRRRDPARRAAGRRGGRGAAHRDHRDRAPRSTTCSPRSSAASRSRSPKTSRRSEPRCYARSPSGAIAQSVRAHP